MSDYTYDRILSVLKSCVAVMAAVVVSHFLLAPAVRAIVPNTLALDVFCAVILIFLIKVAIHTYGIIQTNFINKYDNIENLPQTKSDVESLGIQNPVDYCMAMLIMFTRNNYSTLSLPIAWEIQNQNDDDWHKMAFLFKDYFGKNLHGWSPSSKFEFSWNDCLLAEARIMLGRKQDEDVTDEEIWDLISPSTKKMLRLKRTE